MKTIRLFSDEAFDALVQDFDTQQLAPEAWTHEAHLAVATWYVKNYEFYDACCRIKSGIILLNKAHNTPNHGMRGYHETLTWFWMTVMRLWVEQNPSDTPPGCLNGFLQKVQNNRQLPFLFYEADDIAAPANRAFVMMPGKRPLDWANLQQVIVESA